MPSHANDLDDADAAQSVDFDDFDRVSGEADDVAAIEARVDESTPP